MSGSEESSNTVTNNDKELVPAIDQIPMPIDSQEVLQEFAAEELAETSQKCDDLANGTSSTAETEGWYKRYCRWVPTSQSLLEQAETKVLQYVKTAYEGRWVDIGSDKPPSQCKWSLFNRPEEKKVWTLMFNKDQAGKTPMVIIHGLCASAGLWALNVDALSQDRPVYAFDLIGFGRSSRPKFSSDPMEAELQHVEAIEAWRKEIGLERFVLLGHSMGGFIATSYALKYPDNVAHLVLADPWGFPQKPDQVDKVLPVERSLTLRAVTTIGQLINPLALVRAAGPYGPGLIGRVRPDLLSKFQALNENGGNVAEYIYHCNAQNPTGEEAFRTMMDFFGWAKNPMCRRVHELKSEVPLTMIYGSKTWLQHMPEDAIKDLRPNAHTEVHVVPGAGHHVYADNQSLFNSLVNKAAEIADKILYPNKIPSALSHAANANKVNSNTTVLGSGQSL